MKTRITMDYDVYQKEKHELSSRASSRYYEGYWEGQQSIFEDLGWTNKKSGPCKMTKAQHKQLVARFEEWLQTGEWECYDFNE